VSPAVPAIPAVPAQPATPPCPVGNPGNPGNPGNNPGNPGNNPGNLGNPGNPGNNPGTPGAPGSNEGNPANSGNGTNQGPGPAVPTVPSPGIGGLSPEGPVVLGEQLTRTPGGELAFVTAGGTQSGSTSAVQAQGRSASRFAPATDGLLPVTGSNVEATIMAGLMLVLAGALVTRSGKRNSARLASQAITAVEPTTIRPPALRRSIDLRVKAPPQRR